MSGTLNNIYNNTSFALNLHTEAMSRLQEQVASGSRINRASDDPPAAYRILGLNSQERSLQNYMDSLLEVISLLDISSTTLDAIKHGLSKVTARLSGISGSSGATGIAEEINNWLEDIVLWVNTNHMNQYLFGGSNTASAPYVVTRTDGKITSVTYQGSLEDRNIEVAPGLESSAFCIGDNIFRSNNRSAPIFPDTGTGAAAGTGTSSVRGDVWLTVTGSVGNWTLSVDGGTGVSSNGTETNLAVTSGTGEILYVDTTGITSTGVDWVRVPGTYDIFNALITLRDRLETQGGLTTAQLEELRSNGLRSLDELSNLLLQDSVSIGSKVGFLDDLKESLKNIKYGTEDEVTRLQEADIAQIAIDLSRREVLYQMSLSVAAKLISMSLLDFLR